MLKQYFKKIYDIASRSDAREGSYYSALSELFGGNGPTGGTSIRQMNSAGYKSHKAQQLDVDGTGTAKKGERYYHDKTQRTPKERTRQRNG